MKYPNLDDYQIIDGKPHGSVWFGNALCLGFSVTEPWQQDPQVEMAISHLRYTPNDGLEVRGEQVIFRPPWGAGSLLQRATIAVKVKIFGRAFKVYKLVKKGRRKYKKIYINNKRKRVRVF